MPINDDDYGDLSTYVLYEHLLVNLKALLRVSNGDFCKNIIIKFSLNL